MRKKLFLSLLKKLSLVTSVSTQNISLSVSFSSMYDLKTIFILILYVFNILNLFACTPESSSSKFNERLFSSSLDPSSGSVGFKDTDTVVGVGAEWLEEGCHAIL